MMRWQIGLGQRQIQHICQIYGRYEYIFEKIYFIRYTYYKEVFPKYQSQNTVDPWWRTKDLEKTLKNYLVNCVSRKLVYFEINFWVWQCYMHSPFKFNYWKISCVSCTLDKLFDMYVIFSSLRNTILYWYLKILFLKLWETFI